MMNDQNQLKTLLSVLTVFSIVLLVIFGFNNIKTKKAIDSLEESKSENLEQISSINEKVKNIETILLAAQEENTTLAEALEEAKEKTKSLENQFENIDDTVGDLERLSNTDPELLKKYSRVFFLNEHYAPNDLKTIVDKYVYDPSRKYEIHGDVWPNLKNLMDDARNAGIDISIISAFRSFGEQTLLKGAYTVTYGAGSANQFSADQGYSEHQLGTTVDFTNSTVGASYSGFAASNTYAWLKDNAHKYGFTLSYPENNQYYQFEPWHWRFVGEKLAKKLKSENEYFYDWSQRDIDEYLIYLFD